MLEGANSEWVKHRQYRVVIPEEGIDATIPAGDTLTVAP
jgi:hypothetical protein